MPGIPSAIRRNERISAELIARRNRNSARYAPNLGPNRAFHLVNRRIDYLNQRIESCRIDGKPASLYVDEREALLWMQDKIAELAGKLLDLTGDTDDNQRYMPSVEV